MSRDAPNAASLEARRASRPIPARALRPPGRGAARAAAMKRQREQPRAVVDAGLAREAAPTRRVNFVPARRALRVCAAASRAADAASARQAARWQRQERRHAPRSAQPVCAEAGAWRRSRTGAATGADRARGRCALDAARAARGAARLLHGACLTRPALSARRRLAPRPPRAARATATRRTRSRRRVERACAAIRAPAAHSSLVAPRLQAPSAQELYPESRLRLAWPRVMKVRPASACLAPRPWPFEPPVALFWRRV